MPEWLSTLGVAMGSAWLSGINLYATAATLGLLQRFGLVRLPGDLGVLASWWVIGVAAGMYVIGFVADKIPAVDSAWDVVHTFIRVPAGAVMAAAAFSHADPAAGHRVADGRRCGAQLAWSKGCCARDSEFESRTVFKRRAKPRGRYGRVCVELSDGLVSDSDAGDGGAVSNSVFLAQPEDF